MFTTLHTASFENVPYYIEYQRSTMGWYLSANKYLAYWWLLVCAIQLLWACKRTRKCHM